MISFIVPAHNEEAMIGNCLDAINSAVESIGSEHEIIVVDDASTDLTARFAQQRGAHVIHVAHRNIAATRNAGARGASGEVLFFVDADTLLNAGVMHAALCAIEGGAAGGGCVPLFDGWLPLWARLCYPFMVFASRHLLRQTGGACLFCTRDAFAASGGFSEAHYAAEEVGWIKRIKSYGRFVIPRETVLTSGRSLRNQSLWTIARIFVRLVLRGPDGFRTKRGLDLWYRPAREKATSV
ncbi:MAG: glycosyltransferase [Verrucomicrobiota bacterium]|nr:glycosyltransferase [Verrucomicrobiota bacterium]